MRKKFFFFPQIHDYHMLLNNLRDDEINLLEAFVTGCLIAQLPESQKGYKNSMKRKRKQMSLKDVIIHIQIKEQNKKKDIGDKVN